MWGKLIGGGGRLHGVAKEEGGVEPVSSGVKRKKG
jgi:hypothetical protein